MSFYIVLSLTRGGDGPEMDWGGMLGRGAGFGIYIDDASFSRYRRVVQRLAQQGKLAVVFSDESLVSKPYIHCIHILFDKQDTQYHLPVSV